METLNINRYQKVFGVGPFGFAVSFVIFGLLWLLDRILNHVAILGRPAPIRIAGFVLIAIWICWHSWCIRTINAWWRHDRLCTKGPYRFVRHPMYAGGTLLGFLGVSLMFNSWIMILLPLFSYVVLCFIVRKEEAMMRTVFGEEYQRYAVRTGRLFPRLF
jgi:protein-S-isoprenylcysteine O-methyltransferase Ste14